MHAIILQIYWRQWLRTGQSPDVEWGFRGLTDTVESRQQVSVVAAKRSTGTRCGLASRTSSTARRCSSAGTSPLRRSAPTQIHGTASPEMCHWSRGWRRWAWVDLPPWWYSYQLCGKDKTPSTDRPSTAHRPVNHQTQRDVALQRTWWRILQAQLWATHVRSSSECPSQAGTLSK